MEYLKCKKLVHPVYNVDAFCELMLKIVNAKIEKGRSIFLNRKSIIFMWNAEKSVSLIEQYFCRHFYICCYTHILLLVRCHKFILPSHGHSFPNSFKRYIYLVTRKIGIKRLQIMSEFEKGLYNTKGIELNPSIF